MNRDRPRDRPRAECLRVLHEEIVGMVNTTVVCPNNRTHRVKWPGSLMDGDLIPCEQCGEDAFIRVKLTVEDHPEWREK